MTFEEFERRAWDEWERIPEAYRAGVDGLVVERAAKPHAAQPDVYTLGECLTESYPSSFGDADSIRSVVVLYYGSFFRLSRLDPEFDWAGELWETLTHELQHHLESLADEDALGAMDYAADENHKRYGDEPFDPLFFRHGIDEDGWRRVDDEYFLELPASEAGSTVRFAWRGRTYAAEAPPDAADVVFLDVTEGVEDAPAALWIVLVARRGLGASLRALLRRAPPTILELEAEVRPE